GRFGSPDRQPAPGEGVGTSPCRQEVLRAPGGALVQPALETESMLNPELAHRDYPDLSRVPPCYHDLQGSLQQDQGHVSAPSHHVRQVLIRLLENKLYVKVEKCGFHASSVSFPGFIVSPSHIKMAPEKRGITTSGNWELLAIKVALEEWRHWLEGAEQPFIVWTDHKNLEYHKSEKGLNSCQAR
ncbi:hypothetical protein L3Q82_019673, partial [Scortum barcoo]